MRNGNEIATELNKWINDLDNPDFTCRMEAAEKLGESKDLSSVPFLIRALKDDNENVVNNAIYGLMELGDESAIGALAEILSDTSKKWLRFSAADALGDFRHPDAHSALLFARQHADEELHACIEDSLKRLESRNL